ncbi:hypothetical protein [Spongiivirga citrea]|uniref:hypothetical protein n=1 Tax=Spongiivirga citrea TaxID=1481457 RepID=UPI001954C6A9|nr:hypothetical protein [Spongiivirga citrea]
MKKSLVLAFILVSFFFFTSCKDDQEPMAGPIETDISVSQSSCCISWADTSDLLQQLNNTVSYNYGRALESEVEKTIIFASDSSQVRATVGFKDAFRTVYRDVNVSNNTVTITLEKEEVVQPNIVSLDADGPGDTYELIT